MKTKREIIVSLTPIFITVFIIIFFGAQFRIVDDILINYITEGVYGEGSHQYIILPYMSLIFTFPLYLFKQIFPTMNCYLVSQYLFLTLSFIGLHYLFFKRFHSLGIMIFLWFIQIILLQYFTYTVVAYLMCFVGFLYVFDSENIKLDKIIGVLFILVGISIRKDVFLSLMILMIPLLIYSFIKNRKKTIVSFVVVSSLYLGVSVINTITMINNQIVQNYLSWNELCTQIRDFPMIAYDDYKDAFVQEGVSYNDYECIYDWIFTEKKTLGENQLKLIANQRSLFDTYELNPVNIFIQFFSHPIYVFYFIFVLLLLFIFKIKNYLTIGIILCTLADLSALIVRQRVVERVYIPLLLCGIILLFYQKNEWFTNKEKKDLHIMKLFISIWFFAMFIYGYNFKGWFTVQENHPVTDLYLYVKDHPNDLFVFDKYSQLIKAQYPIDTFVVKSSLYNQNIMTLGNWDTFSLRYYHQLQQYHLQEADSFLEHLHEYDNVKIIMYPDSNKLKFIQNWYLEHKKLNIEFKTIDKVGYMSVMKVEEIRYDKAY